MAQGETFTSGSEKKKKKKNWKYDKFYRAKKWKSRPAEPRNGTR